jgi:hypothetical protein
MTTLELFAYLAIGFIGGFATLVLFAALGSSVIRKEIDEHRARKELLQAQRLEALRLPSYEARPYIPEKAKRIIDAAGSDCQPVRNHAIPVGRMPNRGARR